MMVLDEGQTMKTQRWLMFAAFGLVVWAVTGLGTSQGAVISPVNPATGGLVAPAFTVSIFDPVTGRDITDVWLPEWNPCLSPPCGTSVYVVFPDPPGNVLLPPVRPLPKPRPTAPH